MELDQYFLNLRQSDWLRVFFLVRIRSNTVSYHLYEFFRISVGVHSVSFLEAFEHSYHLLLTSVSNILLYIDTTWANQRSIQVFEVVGGHEENARLSGVQAVQGVQQATESQQVRSFLSSGCKFCSTFFIRFGPTRRSNYCTFRFSWGKEEIKFLKNMALIMMN